MKDYCAYISGIPIFHGSEMAEERVKQVIEAATGEKVVGVSVAWNFRDCSDKVRKTIEADLVEQTDPLSSVALTAVEAPEAPLVGAAKAFRKIDDFMVGLFFGWDEEGDPDIDKEELIKSISSYNKAFIVFNEESARDAAV